ncbi:hypothetical protein TRFO_15521 [Tritrichomonas foetus]|uniref:Conserved oligomeric Golgi complex subunit 3 n=1 Tax=Tritrichomonas foetus TaxID=1144522 RepID=A0A1J4KWY9_9EUKA|nr:hypothetical protein TRFO_15521 [Tritrichomonas foetus]|eukprot:OHT14220.1 hypothetical protein TRFO_15521 [Tritrichomonas foetus]
MSIQPLHFIVSDIPVEWRASIDNIRIPENILPPNLPEKANNPESLTKILIDDPSLHNVPVAMDKTEMLLNSATILQKEILNCRLTLETAELKRRKIASNAELIHGECDSQILAEQRLTIFVKSIDSFLHYFDDLEKITLDFKSPLFTVISPDFSSNLQKIEKGIHFFQMNQNYRDAKSFLLRYQSLQNRAVDIISEHISVTLSQITHRLVTNQKSDESIYTKFISVAPTVRRLFSLSEKTSAFSSVLSIYKNSRNTLLTPLISAPINNSPEIRSRASTVLTYARKEYELAKEFFNFNGHPMYTKCFCELINDIGSCFHDCCYSLLMKVNEIKPLCDTCIVLKGDVLQDEIGRIPVASEKLRSQFMRVLKEAQERLIYRSKIASSEFKGDTDRTIELVSLLYCALPRESFSDIASALIKNCLVSLEESSKKFKNAERDIFLLGNYLALHDRMTNFDCQIIGTTTQGIDLEPVNEFLWRILRIDRSFLKNINEMTRTSKSTVDARKELEDSTSLSFQSLTTYATRLILQPLLDLQVKKIQEKPKILSEIQKAIKDLNSNVETGITNLINSRITSKNYREAVISVLKKHLNEVIHETQNSVGNHDDNEIRNAFQQLSERINQISC